MEENTQESAPSSSPSSKKGINPMIYVFIAIVVIVLIGGGYYLSKKMSHSQQPASPTQSSQQMMMQATPTQATTSGTVTMESSSSASATKEQDITITGSNFKFVPSTVTVKKGEKVKITFTNAEGAHDFVIDELNIKTPVISAGQSQTVEFTPDKAGTFQYYCSVDHHRSMGMQGTLTVE